MANSTFSLVSLFLLCYVLYKVVLTVVTRQRFRSFAAQNGCQEPFDLTGPLPFYSMRRFREIMKLKETGADFLDDIVAEDFRKAPTLKATTFDGSNLIETADPANIQAILATQVNDFALGSRRYNAFSPLLGDSIFTAEGAFWEHSRALFRPQFARENINDLAMTEQACADLIDAIGSCNSQGWTADTDILPLLYNFTLDTATDFLFGESINSQIAATAEKRGMPVDSSANAKRLVKLEEVKEFVYSFSIINDTCIRRIRLGRLYWTADSRAFRNALRVVRGFTQHFVKLATNHSGKMDTKKDSLLNNLATQVQDPTELQNQILSILLAGRDTTAALISWCIVRLALHPEICNKLRSIILRDLPSHETITFEKLKGCRYLQHFINEVSRLHPTIPMNSRNAIKDTTLPVGGGADQSAPIAVRKGQGVIFSVYVMHRRKDLWGEDALEFRPERWEGRFPAWQFLPFGGGPRICLGQQFALTETSFLLCRLLQEFDTIEPVDRTEMAKLRKGLGLTMWARDAKVRFHKA